MSERKIKVGRKLKADELSAFSLQMAMMLKAGILPSVAVESLMEDSTDKQERELLGAICGELNKGAPFSAALETTGCFPGYMINMLAIGESSGKLESVCEDLARHYAKDAQLADSIRQAATYPSLMLLLMVAIVLVLTAEVLPIFQSVYDDLGVTITPMAEAMLSAGDASKIVLLVVTLLVALVLLVGVIAAAVPALKRGLTALGYKLFGSTKLMKSISLSRFCSSVALMLYAGLNYTEAVKQARTLVENTKTRKQVDACIDLLEQGQPLSAATSQSGLITGLPASLLSAGIKSGAADKAMSEVANRYADRADNQINKAVGRIEPALVIILCVIVGLVLLSVMLPLIGIMTRMGA